MEEPVVVEEVLKPLALVWQGLVGWVSLPRARQDQPVSAELVELAGRSGLAYPEFKIARVEAEFEIGENEAVRIDFEFSGQCTVSGRFIGFNSALLGRVIVLDGEVEIKENFISPTLYSFSVKTKGQSRLRVNTNYFPGWQVEVDGQKEKTSLEKDGAFDFHLPPGSHQVKIQFRETSLRLISNAISLASLLILGLKVIQLLI